MYRDLATKRLPLLVVLGLVGLAIAVPMTGGELGLGGTPGPGGLALPPTASLAPPTAVPGASADPSEPSGSADPPGPQTSSPPTQPPPTPTPAPLVEIAIVPVTQFRATVNSTTPEEVRTALAGTSDRFEALTLVEADADAILAALGVDRPAEAKRLVLVRDAAALAKDLAKHRKRLAFLRVDDVTPAVRALAWGGRTLFGVGRVKEIGNWRLTAMLPAGTTPTLDPGATWTLFAGGDILLDRGVYQTIRINGKGVDFPFDGGTAEIIGHTCCSSFGWEVPQTRRTGNAGAVRKLISGADLAIANFENPAPNRVRWHTSGTVFSADPAIIDGLVDAGIDYVSLANNHIGDAGDTGILQTIANLKKRGLAYSGAGKDAAAARKPAVLEANGVNVAVLGYDAIARSNAARTDEIGSSQLTLKRATTDIKRARAGGADVVIVFPHWGTEYQSRPFDGQQQLARDIIDAGADMIIGNHAHYAAAMEVHKGKPIWYALGNFVFDQTWSEPTMEGITLELTFHGAELLQIRMRPHIILDKAQPNFLSLGGDGRVVMGQVFDASKGLLPW